jgi:hypothetical protein
MQYKYFVTFSAVNIMVLEELDASIFRAEVPSVIQIKAPP